MNDTTLPRRRPDRSRPLRTLALALVLCAPAALCAPPAHAVQETASRTETFPIEPSPGAVLRVCNINGPVTGRGVSGASATVRIEETYRARTEAGLERAKREMAVTVRREGDLVEISVGGPCRGSDRDHPDHRHRRDRDAEGYEAEHRFEVEIPHGVRAELSTVNGGAVRLTGHRGGFEVRNVNGAATLEEAAGSGSASTVNGPLAVSFAENPTEDCTFSNVNGEIDLAFQPGLAASFSFRTLNGEVYTDFPFEMAPEVLETTHDRDGARHRVRRRWRTAVEIGGGGPQHDITTVNGDVLIRDRRASRGGR